MTEEYFSDKADGIRLSVEVLHLQVALYFADVVLKEEVVARIQATVELIQFTQKLVETHPRQGLIQGHSVPVPDDNNDSFSQDTVHGHVSLTHSWVHGSGGLIFQRQRGNNDKVNLRAPNPWLQCLLLYYFIQCIR